MNRFQEFCEYWRKAPCPECKKTNWIYDSHSQRHYPDIRDGCKCWSCGNKFWIGERDEFDIVYMGQLEDHDIETVLNEHLDYFDGRETPE